MKLWRVAVCLVVLAVAGCSSGPLIPPHTVALLRGSHASAELDVVSGATTISVGTAKLGAQLLQVSTPADSGIKPDLVPGSKVMLYLDSTGLSGPAAVRILLNPAVTWRLEFAGGTTATSVDLGHGRVSGVDFAAGTSAIAMTLPRPAGTTTVVLAGGASQATLRVPAGVPARLRLDGGAASATIGGRTYSGIAGGTVLAAPGWAQATSRYDVQAAAGVSAISVTS